MTTNGYPPTAQAVATALSDHSEDERINSRKRFRNENGNPIASEDFPMDPMLAQNLAAPVELDHALTRELTNCKKPFSIPHSNNDPNSPFSILHTLPPRPCHNPQTQLLRRSQSEPRPVLPPPCRLCACRSIIETASDPHYPQALRWKAVRTGGAKTHV